jgi:hypothetical protein
MTSTAGNQTKNTSFKSSDVSVEKRIDLSLRPDTVVLRT